MLLEEDDVVVEEREGVDERREVEGRSRETGVMHKTDESAAENVMGADKGAVRGCDGVERRGGRGGRRKR